MQQLMKTRSIFSGQNLRLMAFRNDLSLTSPVHQNGYNWPRKLSRRLFLLIDYVR